MKRHHNSVFLGIEALHVLLKARRSQGVTQLASALGLSKSTAHDLLSALGELGFVEQSPTTRRYAISPEIFSFLHLFSTEYGPNSTLKPFLREHAARLRATLVVTVLSRRATYAICASGSAADTFLIGDNGPAYNSACGKVLVAQRPASQWPDFAPRPEDKLESPFTNHDPERFYAELRAAHADGVAWNLRERDPELCSVAAPIAMGEKPWTRAIGLALPCEEWARRDRAGLAADVQALAADVAKLLVR